MSILLPSFLVKLADPNIKNILLCGCGGGFDFVHSLLLYPELKRLGKQIIIGSYSFGEAQHIGNPAEIVFQEGNALAKRVSARSIPPSYYCPEVHVCSYLDRVYPDTAPHFVYAYYARAFTVPSLTRFYQQLVESHQIDALILVDGGSDSLMVGDEEGLGDPIEDAVSVATVAGLDNLKLKLLISVGLGCDRFNHVSDAASLRAVSELTASGGFLGSIGLEAQNQAFQFYKSCVEHIYQHQQFRSVIASSIIAAGEGNFSNLNIPESVAERVASEQYYLWYLMAILWAFDVDKVAERSLIVEWIHDQESVLECYAAMVQARRRMSLRQVENLPSHEHMRNLAPRDY